MKLSPELKYDTSPEWAKTVMSDFNAFLQDHADCAKKHGVAKCPDKTKIIPWLIETAVGVDHFQKVYAIMEQRGVQLMERYGQTYILNNYSIMHVRALKTVFSTGC